MYYFINNISNHISDIFAIYKIYLFFRLRKKKQKVLNYYENETHRYGSNFFRKLNLNGSFGFRNFIGIFENNFKILIKSYSKNRKKS